MKQVMKTISSVLLRTVLLLAGLVFLASLLLAALLLAALWLLGALWARLTGRPVSPWTFRLDRQALWQRFYRPPVQTPGRQRDDANVIDVEPKESKPPGR